MIQEYIKNNKKHYKVRNHYIGTNVYTGKEIRVNKSGFKSRKEAELFISRQLIAFENGRGYIDNKKISLDELYTMFIEQHQHNIKGGSLNQIKCKYKRLDKIKDFDIKKLTLPLLQSFINELSKKYKKDTLLNTKALINQLLDYAVKLNYLDKNIAKHLTIPRYEVEKISTQEKFYNKEELKEFLQIVNDNYDLETLLIFRLLSFTGARKGEILALKWEDIDFKKGTIDINKTATLDKYSKFCINSTKTATSNRVISVDNGTIELLKRYRIKSNTFNINNRLFNGSHNNYFNDILKKVYKQFPHLKIIKIHGFRHTHASLLFESGASIKEVQERLGHSNINTTMNIYTHVTNKQQEETAIKFADFMAL